MKTRKPTITRQITTTNATIATINREDMSIIQSISWIVGEVHTERDFKREYKKQYGEEIDGVIIEMSTVTELHSMPIERFICFSDQTMERTQSDINDINAAQMLYDESFEKVEE